MNINGGKENLITTISNLALFCLLVTKSQLIPSKNISSIYLLLYIIQASIIAVGDNCLTLFLKCIHIIYNLATKECTSIFQGWFVDDDLGALCFDTLHDTLDGRLAEVVAV